jgi:transposase
MCSPRSRSHLVQTFATTTVGLIELGEWLEENGCTQVAMEATGVYWKPVWKCWRTVTSNSFCQMRHT